MSKLKSESLEKLRELINSNPTDVEQVVVEFLFQASCFELGVSEKATDLIMHKIYPVLHDNDGCFLTMFKIIESYIEVAVA